MTTISRAHWCWRAVRALALMLSWALPTIQLTTRTLSAQDEIGLRAPSLRLLTIDGVIGPLSARYLERELSDAATAGAVAVVLELDTPGGLERSMRQMTTAIMESPVPVIVYVAPRGAHAASAGMFLTLAAHVAAMAPGTNIGAAHPVGIGGQQQPDTVMVAKVINDAAALARAIAETRGRNAAWAEEAVRQSVSITAEEALSANVIDLIADDTGALLRELDGRRVATAAGETVLRTADAPVEARRMRLTERILQAIADPDIAYILLTIGVVGIIAELYNPGALFPGITGGISLILAFTAFGSLPINWAGVLLLAIAAVLFVAELSAEGIGVLAGLGVVAFLLGSLMLYVPFGVPSPALPDVRVSRWLIAVMTAGIAAFFLVVLRAIVRARRAPVVTGERSLVDREGIAVSGLAPRGRVRIDMEVWSAVAETGGIEEGEEVVVTGVEGVTLRVRRR